MGGARGLERDGPGTRQADVGAGTLGTRQTTQKRRDNSPRMGTSVLRPWRVPWKALQRCRTRQELDPKSSRVHPRLGFLPLENVSKLKGSKRALTVHGLPHRIQIRRRSGRPSPRAATARHGGGRGGREKVLTRN